ncbi:MAG: radical SAM protein [Myxococcota bacterium]|nr:radical SAM protein [Myxococcota bacterium]
MKVLLVQPAPFEPGRLGLENVLWMSEPVALTQLAGTLLPEHEVKILDMRLEPEMVLNETLLEFKPDLVGSTSMTTDCYQAKAILQVAKQTLGDTCFTIVGGHHPTLAPQDFENEVVDCMCLGEGEETFLELIKHLDAGGDPRQLSHIDGLRYRDADGNYHTTSKRSQMRELDTLPLPARHLLPERYRKEYFFAVANPMASMETSRGCSFDCNFCAIWEFYDRKTRYMSAEAICDRLEKIPEDYVFFLDDNFLSDKKRLEALCDEIERRGIKKYYGTQGRTDFMVANPELMKRLSDIGFMMILSGYESNSDNNLDALRKRNTADNNRKAIEMLRKLGIVSTGIFMARQDFSEEDFDNLYEIINDMGVAIPLVVIHTPLPGTQLWREREHELLTRDSRFFDLLHSVLPTKLPRETFYKKFVAQNDATWPALRKGLTAAMRRKPKFFLKSIPGTVRFLKRIQQYRPIASDYESHLRDEIGIIPQDIRIDSDSVVQAKERKKRLNVIQGATG